jgi:hypothetical protein
MINFLYDYNREHFTLEPLSHEVCEMTVIELLFPALRTTYDDDLINEHDAVCGVVLQLCVFAELEDFHNAYAVAPLIRSQLPVPYA